MRLRAPTLAPAAAAAGRSAVAVSTTLITLGFVLVCVHVAFGRESFDPISRALFAIPGILVLAEAHRFYKEGDRTALPFNVLALLQYYVTFAFPSLLDIQFFDLNGPVIFTEQVRFLGAVAVSGGSVVLFLAMRAGERLGARAQRPMISACPPDQLPEGFSQAAWATLIACVVLTVILISAPNLIPGSLSMVVLSTVTFEFAIGVGLARPELLKGPWTQRLGFLAYIIGALAGLLRGTLDPAIRLGMVLMARRWSSTRKLPLTMIGALAGIYLLFQPVKADFRAQVWGSQEQVGYTARVDAWSGALGRYWGRDEAQEGSVTSALTRISELDSVIHALQVVPVTVPYLDGQGWTYILASPIPRVIWPDKPTTQNTDQRYAIAFNRQTETGARTTAILLPLLIDGYWNLGWPGIFLACTLMGMWTGFCQRLWAGDHWALQAMGVAHLALLVVQGSIGSLFSGLFQHMTGLLIGCWAVYGIASLMSNKRGRDAAPVFAPRRAPPRRAPSR